MKIAGLVLAAVLVAAAAASAQALYINDVVHVTLRAGPGYDHKTVTVLRSGDRVDVLEKGGDWSRVKAPDGSQGWVLARLLTEKTPNALKLRHLEQQLEAIQGRGGPTGEDLAALVEEKLQLQNTLAEVRFELEALRQAYAELEKQGGPDPQADQDLASARQQLDRQAEALAQCRRAAAETQREKTLGWFLAGAMVLLAGLLIGLAMGRRRTSKLY
jgi:SH3 domain protein